MTNNNNAPKGMAIALLGFGVFASHDALIKYLGADYAVFQIIFFAMLFSFVPTTLMVLADHRVDNFRPHHPWLVPIRSLLMIVAMSGAFYAFVTLPLTQVYPLLFSTPLLITVFSVPLLGEVVRLQRWIAVLVGMAGVLIVLRPGMVTLELGHYTAILAACCSALASIVVRKIGNEERTAVLILYPLLMSIMAMAVMMPNVYIPVQLKDLGLMGLVGVLSVCAQMCIIIAYRSAPAALIAPLQYSQIIWASVFGYLFFQETPDMYVAVGSSIIIASGVFVVWRETRQNVSAITPVLRTSNPRFDSGTMPHRNKIGTAPKPHQSSDDI